MATGKRYSTDYLVDSNNNTGSTGQVLTSTLTGIDWADGSGSSIIGGPYLPLSGGSGVGQAMTGPLFISTPDNPTLTLENTDNSGDPVITFKSSNPITTEGAQLFYVNNVGTLHITTTYANAAASIIFNTATGTDQGTNNERMRITGDGNVGINTTTPQVKLEVKSSAHSQFAAHFGQGQNNSAGVFGGISLGYTEANTAYRKVAIVAQALGDGAARQNLHFLVDTANDGGSAQLADTKMMIDGLTGNVGIGTTDPKSKLHIQGGDIGVTTGMKIGWLYNPTASPADANMYNYIKTDNNGGVPASPLEISGSRWTNGNTKSVIFTHQTPGEIMTIMTGGNVGIGDTSPSFPLVVSKSSSSTSNGADDSFRFALVNPDQTNNNYALMSFSDGTAQPGSGFFGMQFTDHTNNYGDLCFGTRGASGFGERMRIISGGKVGIGTTNPTGLLHVKGDTNSNGGELYLQVNNNNTTDNIGTISFGNNIGVALSRIQAQTSGANNNSNLVFFTSTAATRTQKMVIDSAGNVGIGVTSPLSKLHILDSSSTATKLTIGASGEIPIITAGGTNTDLQIQAVGPGGFLDFKTNGSSRMHLRSDGTVGIGSTSPNAPLDVTSSTQDSSGIQQWSYKSGASSYRLQLNTIVSSGLVKFSFDQLNAGASYNNVLVLDRGNVGIGDSAPSSISANTFNLSINSSRNDLSGAYITKANGTIKHQQYWDSSGYGFNLSASSGDFYWKVNNNEKMRIKAGGNVGIGTTLPNAKLTVRGNIDLQGEGVGNCGTRYIRYDCVDASTTNAIAITSAANIGIGKDSPAVRLDVADSEAGSGFSNGVARFENTIETSSGGAGVLNVANNYNGGFGTLIKFWYEESSVATINFNSSTNAVVYNTTSDYRLKEDLKSFNGLEIIDQIKTYNYKWKKAEARGYGALAHELQEVFPDAVTGDKDGEDMQGVDYSTLVPVLIKSIQELKVEIELLKQQINN